MILGIDVGGSGIKGAPVDMQTGELAGERFRLETPQPATPDAMIATMASVVEHFGLPPETPIGVGFPAVVKNGVVHTAANIDASWIGVNAEEGLRKATGRPVSARIAVGNDADVAGLAEIRWGAGKGVQGIVLMVTLGTGIGSGLFWNGKLIPNTELGHVPIIHHGEAEKWASDGVREREDLKWPEWAERVETYLRLMENLLWPDLIILGGGVSKKSDKWLPGIKIRTPLVIASLKNEAGIVGAAMLAAEEIANSGNT